MWNAVSNEKEWSSDVRREMLVKHLHRPLFNWHVPNHRSVIDDSVELTEVLKSGVDNNSTTPFVGDVRRHAQCSTTQSLNDALHVHKRLAGATHQRKPDTRPRKTKRGGCADTTAGTRYDDGLPGKPQVGKDLIIHPRIFHAPPNLLLEVKPSNSNTTVLRRGEQLSSVWTNAHLLCR